MSILSFLMLAVLQGAGQQAAARPSFEAATIKPSKVTDDHSSWHSRTGMMVIENVTLRNLITIAYKMRSDQVTGGPKWMDTDRFDVNAKSAGPAENDQLLLMLQSLLEERFQVTLHPEKRTVTAYALTIAKGGLKIKPAEGGKGSSSSSGKGVMTVKGMSMSKLADSLTRVMGNPVTDQTATAPAVFDFRLEWSQEDDGSGPSITAALPEQLGLKLQGTKAEIDFLVVDRAEKPAEN